MPCVNKTSICTASTQQTLSAILLPGTRVGVRGVTLEHFHPPLTELSLSPSQGAVCTADHWLGHGVSETRLKSWGFFSFFLTQLVLESREDTKTLQRCCLTTISSLAPEDSSRCMWERAENRKCVTIYLQYFLILYLFLLLAFSFLHTFVSLPSWSIFYL